MEREEEKLIMTIKKEKDARSKISQLTKTAKNSEEDLKAANTKKKSLGENFQRDKVNVLQFL